MPVEMSVMRSKGAGEFAIKVGILHRSRGEMGWGALESALMSPIAKKQVLRVKSEHWNFQTVV